MSSLPLLIGPIPVGSSFMLAHIRNNAPAILNYNDNRYYWEHQLSVLLTSSTIPIFNAVGTIDNLTLNDSTNHGGVTLTSDNSIVINTNPPGRVRMTQETYANWYPPDILLSAVPYSIQDLSGNVIARIYTTTNKTTTTLANGIIILPILWYTNCTNSGSYDIINTPLQSITNWMCIVSPSLPECTGVELISSGWTNLADCVNGVKYTYCSVGTNCGECKGPCSVIYDDCTSSSSGEFTCIFNPSKFFDDTRWWESPYFIGAIITIVIIIVIVIAIIVLRH